MRKPREIVLFLLLGMGLGQVASAAPATHVQSVTHNSETITMRLTRENLRGAHFELWAQNAAGTYDVVTPVAERSYLGTVDEHPGAVSYGILQDDGTFKGGVIFDRGRTWYTLGNSVFSASGVAQPTSFGYTTMTLEPGKGGSKVYGFDVGIDARYEYFNERGGGSVHKTLEVIEYSLVGTRALYVHDALLRPYLGRVIVRTDQAQDPANGLTGGTYLDAVRNHWNNNHTDADRDVVAGVATSHVWAGLAWVNVIASGSAYSVNDSQGDGNFFNVWRHELGHNWGLSHYDGGAPEAGTINSNNHFARMSGPELQKVLNHRDSQVWALDNLGSMSTVNIPPYASYDARSFTQGVDSQITINVLANDHDANGHALTLVSVQSTTARGGSASVQNGQVVYTPDGNFLGVDSFTYTIQDSSGQIATGAVAVDVLRGDRLRFYANLDETTGVTANDFSPFNDDATLSGTDFAASSVAGQFGNAVNLDGTDDHFTTSWVTLQSNTVTLAAWIKRGATVNPWSGIIFDRTYSASGFGFGSGGELRYHWNDTQWSWSSGLVPAADTWTFVALVVEPGKATMYMNDGSGFQTAVNNVSHAAASFGNVTIGQDPAQVARHFLGAIDEARIYSEALSQVELQNVMNGGSAEGPTPFDTASNVGPVDLTWVPSAAAIEYQVYLGTNATAVQNATTASPEYKGAVSSPALVNPPTAVSATNYWRVDTVTSSGTITGSVWSFTRNNLEKVLIVNHSFEAGSGTGVPTGWTLTAGSGSSLGTGAGGSDGAQFLWIGTGVTITQDLNHTLVDGETFTLQYSSSRTYPRNIQLLAKDGGAYQLIAQTTEPTGSSGWPTITFTRTMGTAFAGQQLALRIVSGNWNEFDNFRLTRVAPAVSNQSPGWNSNPVVEAGATEGVPYGSSLADDATDPDSDPLTFSKVSGPAWLVVASDGTLSGTPGSSSSGLNSWTVRVSDPSGATADATLEIQVANVNQAPGFAADPIVKADATEAVAYAGSLGGDASDPDSDPLTFSKNGGPAWLAVAASGALSGTPGSADVGVNQWTVRVTDSGGLSDTATLRITVDAQPTDPVTYGPTGESTLYGSVFSGSTAETLVSDNSYQVLREEQTGGRPSNRISRLEHTWTFDVGTGGSEIALELEAHHQANTEGDDFIFSWSADGTNFTDVITVTKTSDDDQAQTATLPANLTGPVWVRVRDADRTPGRSGQHTVSIDRLNLMVTP